MLCKFCILAVVALSLLSLTLGQVSFSTNWGSGKRSSSSFIAPQADDACWTKSNAKLLYDLMQVIQKQVDRLVACQNSNDDLHRI
uniref:Adipokinetic hormone peptide n=1 Tax=Magallana gigas TaxID=29159 RepID=A0A1C6ZYI4_MAGGI|nr:adipokinetic hormone peptide [Crassostrea gigas]